MRYTDSVKQFWKVGEQLFKVKCLPFMGIYLFEMNS